MLGEVIHGYRVDRAMSEDKGGFGDVYFATHVDSGAEAVVKVLKPEMSAQRDIVARFFNEARAAASVHHPGVVQIHNVGYHGDRAYLLMERLRGNDLEGRLAAGPLPVERAIVFMRQAAGAVGAAHERGIVHRDLKPANLFVVADPDVVGGERVKVLDFGIAKLTADATAGKTQGVFGTPSYMSPEQCASTGAVDGRADLYSLGCIFYELVCGRPPFGHGGLELIAAHLRDVPVPPRAIAPWLPPAVEQVILGLLEKQPERRIPSCAALIAALDDAARASGLVAGASAPYLPAAAGAQGNLPYAPMAATAQRSVPYVPAVTGAQASVPYAPSGGPSGIAGGYSTTLGSAAGAATTPPGKRSTGVWLGLGAVAVVAGGIAVILAVPGHRSPAGGGSGSAGSGGSAALVAGLTDAGVAVAPLDAAVPSDAAQVAVASLDAAATADRPDVLEPHPPAPAGASSQAEIAAKLNEQGKARMLTSDYEQARRLFAQAVARDPQATYFVNLATVDLRIGQLDAAATALRGALQHRPTVVQSARIKRLFGLIAQQAKRQGIAITPPISPSELGAKDAPAADPEPPPREQVPSQADLAARLNEEGKNLMYASKFSEAARKFQEAVARVPEAKYFVNLCLARFQEGKFDEALTACGAVELNNPTAEQQAKASRLIKQIEDEARKQGIELHRMR